MKRILLSCVMSLMIFSCSVGTAKANVIKKTTFENVDVGESFDASITTKYVFENVEKICFSDLICLGEYERPRGLHVYFCVTKALINEKHYKKLDKLIKTQPNKFTRVPMVSSGGMPKIHVCNYSANYTL